jgi:NADPH-dependent curcumin reductase CurA
MQQVVLRAHPRGNPTAEDFALEAVAMPSPGPGEVLLRTLWLSVDPYMRLALDNPPRLMGMPPVALGGLMPGGAVCEVLTSNDPAFAPGDVVEGRTGWRTFAAVVPSAAKLRKVPEGVPPSAALSVLGLTGLSAYAGMVPVGGVKAGETVVVSAAAGAVGSLAGQIGKIHGARVIGIAGGAEKCAAVEALGFDRCVDYRAADYPARLAAACGDGIDLYFENVGGAVTDAVLPLCKYGARMPVCGFISYYGVGDAGPGPDRLPGFMRMVMAKGLQVLGFTGAYQHGPDAIADLARWLKEGRIRQPEIVVDGLAAAAAAFAGIFAGNANVGKLLVRVAADA